MIKTRNGILLPDSYFPEAQYAYHNKTNEIQQMTIHSRLAGVDESIHQYINEPSNRIHVAPHLRKIIQIEAELISSDKELEKAKFVVPLRKDFKGVKGIKVSQLLKSDIPYNIKEILLHQIDFDLISNNDIVVMPNQTYRWGSGKAEQWYTKESVSSQCEYYGESIVTNRDVKVFDYISLMHCSNNRPMSEEELYKIKRFLSIEDTKQLALDVMNVLNPTTSYIELMIAFNCIPDEMKKKNKAKILPLMQELYNLDVSVRSYSLEQITGMYKRFFGTDPSQKQLEFICDHYESRYVESSSIFEFKLKLKD